jgi:hypothetical protein
VTVVQETAVWICNLISFVLVAMDNMSMEELLEAVAKSFYPPSMAVSVH